MRMSISMCDKYINVCEDILCGGKTEDIVSAASAIAEKYLAPLMPEYSKIVGTFVSGYKKLFPKHLQDDADRMCQQMFLGFYSVLISCAQRTGAVKRPSPNCCCDVMVQFKKP